ncbi:hypothetical protein VTJ04DRAFT_6943 [Mycothermus thermophilus]|uniref:uncharacterized protein n=1 Tax=Humicola insolens TaxID=85995 RepID=UPI003744128A
MVSSSTVRSGQAPLCKLVPPCKDSHSVTGDENFVPVGRYHANEVSLLRGLGALKTGKVYGAQDFLTRAEAWYKAELDRKAHFEKAREEANMQPAVAEPKHAPESTTIVSCSPIAHITTKIPSSGPVVPGPTKTAIQSSPAPARRGKKRKQQPTRIQPARAAKQRAIEALQRSAYVRKPLRRLRDVSTPLPVMPSRGGSPGPRPTTNQPQTSTVIPPSHRTDEHGKRIYGCRRNTVYATMKQIEEMRARGENVPSHGYVNLIKRDDEEVLAILVPEGTPPEPTPTRGDYTLIPPSPPLRSGLSWLDLRDSAAKSPRSRSGSISSKNGGDGNGDGASGKGNTSPLFSPLPHPVLSGHKSGSGGEKQSPPGYVGYHRASSKEREGEITPPWPSPTPQQHGQLSPGLGPQPPGLDVEVAYFVSRLKHIMRRKISGMIAARQREQQEQKRREKQPTMHQQQQGDGGGDSEEGEKGGGDGLPETLLRAGRVPSIVAVPGIDHGHEDAREGSLAESRRASSQEHTGSPTTGPELQTGDPGQDVDTAKEPENDVAGQPGKPPSPQQGRSHGETEDIHKEERPGGAEAVAHDEAGQPSTPLRSPRFAEEVDVRMTEPTQEEGGIQEGESDQEASIPDRLQHQDPEDTKPKSLSESSSSPSVVGAPSAPRQQDPRAGSPHNSPHTGDVDMQEPSGSRDADDGQPGREPQEEDGEEDVRQLDSADESGLFSPNGEVERPSPNVEEANIQQATGEPNKLQTDAENTGRIDAPADRSGVSTPSDVNLAQCPPDTPPHAETEDVEMGEDVEEVAITPPGEAGHSQPHHTDFPGEVQTESSEQVSATSSESVRHQTQGSPQPPAVKEFVSRLEALADSLEGGEDGGGKDKQQGDVDGGHSPVRQSENGSHDGDNGDHEGGTEDVPAGSTATDDPKPPSPSEAAGSRVTAAVSSCARVVFEDGKIKNTVIVRRSSPAPEAEMKISPTLGRWTKNNGGGNTENNKVPTAAPKPPQHSTPSSRGIIPPKSLATTDVVIKHKKSNIDRDGVTENTVDNTVEVFGLKFEIELGAGEAWQDTRPLRSEAEIATRVRVIAPQPGTQLAAPTGPENANFPVALPILAPHN